MIHHKDCPSGLVLSSLLALLISGAAAAATIHVPGDYANIQPALNTAAPGDTVRVDPGTYHENIIWPGIDGIRLIGAGPAETIIDGNRAASVIRFETAQVISGATVVEGFTIRNGFAQPPWPESQGGGIYLFYADPLLRNLWIVENEADDFGGGIYNWWSNPQLVRVVIARNTAISRGGVDCFHGTPHFDHVTVTGNTPGGIYFDTRTLPLLENSVVALNYDYGIELQGTYIEPTQINLAYTDVYGGILLVGVVQVNDLGGNITENPRFVDPGAGDYGLLGSSPCIDAADPDYPPDPDSTRSDMGAFPYNHGTSSVGPVAGRVRRGLMLAAGPNPVFGATLLTFSLPQEAAVTLRVFDPAGRAVRALLDHAVQGPGRQVVTWDGTDAQGRPVASGAYLCRLEALGRAETSRVVVVH